MKVKLDENVPADLVAALEQLGHEVDTVPQEMLTGRADPVVQRAAQAESRFLVTQDKKFIDERNWLSNPGAGAMLVRIDNENRERLTSAVVNAFATEPVETWYGCIVVVTEARVRVRPLRRKESP